MQTYTNTPAPAAPARDWKQALSRGFRGRCPNCAEGRIFASYLKVNPVCSACGLKLDGHRADDMPPYITMLLVGHIIVSLNLFFEQAADWPILWHMLLWPALTAVLALSLLQPIKGALISYQWALGMHGFDPAGEAHVTPANTKGA